MSTQSSTIDFILDQLRDVPNVRTQKMFGEYALYCNEKVVGLVCDDTLFIKITPEGKEFVGAEYEEGCAYPGAKPSILISLDKLEDPEWISHLVRTTAERLPEPKKKK